MVKDAAGVGFCGKVQEADRQLKIGRVGGHLLRYLRAIERAALELEQINLTFMKDLPARVDERIAKEFPNGIPSEI